MRAARPQDDAQATTCDHTSAVVGRVVGDLFVRLHFAQQVLLFNITHTQTHVKVMERHLSFDLLRVILLHFNSTDADTTKRCERDLNIKKSSLNKRCFLNDDRERKRGREGVNERGRERASTTLPS